MRVDLNWAVVWQAASAIATTAAVIVALWQTHYQNKKKLKMNFVENMTYLPSTGRGKVARNQYFAINIANAGNRKVSIQRVGIQGLNGHEFHIQPSEPYGATIHFPYDLDVEKSLSFPMEKEVVLKNIYEQLKQTRNLSKDRPLKFFAMDSVGKKHFCKTKKSLQWYFEEYKITD